MSDKIKALLDSIEADKDGDGFICREMMEGLSFARIQLADLLDAAEAMKAALELMLVVHPAYTNDNATRAAEAALDAYSDARGTA